jgi:heme exporter protein A
MLDTVDLECTRGERLLFAGLAFAVEAGHCLHVAGENGAGKTSLLRILCGLLVPTHGEVRWGGTDIRRLREDYWQVLAYVGHLNGVKDELTALENVRFAAALAGHPAGEDAARHALAAVGLAGFESSQARALSQGQRRRIGLARLFLARAAKLWILDEPFTALDVRGVAALSTLIGEQLERGGIVVLTTHQEVPLPGRVRRLELRAQAVHA